jgi:enoyl-CoA hydratase
MSASRAREVLFERDGGLLRVTLDRPDRHNALSMAMLRALRDGLRAASADPSLGCVTIAGAGSSHFAAGGDLNELDSIRSEEDTARWVREARDALDAVRDCPVPVVAVLNGDAIGGGAELALACDARLMRDGAQIGYVHGRLAITPAWGGGTDLVALVGPARALRMMCRYEMVPAALALEWGLADASAAADRMDLLVADFLGPMLAQPPSNLRAAKALVSAARAGATRQQLRALEERHLLESWQRPEHWQAVERFFRRERGGNG